MNKIRMKNRRILLYFFILKDKEILFNGQRIARHCHIVVISQQRR